MAISFDASSFDSWTTWTTHTLSHTCNGTDRLLVVTAYVNTISDVISGITYNGVAMTRINWINDSSWEWIYMYYLLNPTTGANNIVTTTTVWLTCIMQNASYTGMLQSSQPNISWTSWYLWGTTTRSTSVTTTVDNCWTVWIFRAWSNQTVIAGTTFRAWVNATLQIWDSNWPKTPAGTTSVWVTLWSNFTAQIVASFAPSVSTTNSNFFMFL